jgi:hypothetical protein
MNNKQLLATGGGLTTVFAIVMISLLSGSSYKVCSSGWEITDVVGVDGVSGIYYCNDWNAKGVELPYWSCDSLSAKNSKGISTRCYTLTNVSKLGIDFSRLRISAELVNDDPLINSSYLGGGITKEGVVWLEFVVDGNKTIWYQDDLVDKVVLVDDFNKFNGSVGFSLYSYNFLVHVGDESDVYEFVILATDAEHLDSNKQFIKDVFDDIKEIDGIYAEIPVGNYVRVTFEQNITNANYIKFVVAGDFNSTRWYGVEAYQDDKFLGEVDINFNKTTYVTISELFGEEDVFDLRVYRKDWIESSYYDSDIEEWLDNSSWIKSYSGGSLLFDYIEDDVNVTGCGEIFRDDNTVYTMNESLTCSGAGLEIRANNVTLDCKGFNLIGGGANRGVQFTTSRNNAVIKNCNITNFATGIYAGAITVTNLTIINTTISTVTNAFLTTGNLYNVNISDNDFSSSSDVLLISDGTTDINENMTIQNNIIKTTGASKYGIYFRGTLTNLNVINNFINTTNDALYFASGSVTDTLIKDNTLIGLNSIESGATTTITNFNITNNILTGKDRALYLSGSTTKTKGLTAFNNTLNGLMSIEGMYLLNIDGVVIDDTWFVNGSIATNPATSSNCIKFNFNANNVTIKNLNLNCPYTGVHWLGGTTYSNFSIYNNTVKVSNTTGLSSFYNIGSVSNRFFYENNTHLGKPSYPYSIYGHTNSYIRNEKMQGKQYCIYNGPNGGSINNVTIENVTCTAPTAMFSQWDMAWNNIVIKNSNFTTTTSALTKTLGGGTNISIFDNYFYANTNDVLNLNLYNNIEVYNNNFISTSNTAAGHEAIYLTTTNNTKIYNNNMTKFEKAVAFSNSSNTQVYNNIFQDTKINFASAGTGTSIDNTIIDNNNVSNTYSSFLVSATNILNNFTFKNNYVSGGTYQIMVYHQGTVGSPSYFINNTFTGGNQVFSSQTYTPKNMVVANNTILTGVTAFNNGNNITYENNDIKRGVTHCLIIYNIQVEDVIFKNNKCNVTNDFINVYGGSLTAINNTYKDGIDGDFSLSSTGPSKVTLIDQPLNYMAGLNHPVNLTIEKTSYGKISFLESFNLTKTFSNFNNIIKVENNNIFVDTATYPELNISANLSFYNTDSLGLTDKFPYRNGESCSPTICTELVDADTYIFNVTHFTNYSVGQSPGNDPVVSLIINNTIPEQYDSVLINCTADAGIGTLSDYNFSIYYPNGTLYYEDLTANTSYTTSFVTVGTYVVNCSATSEYGTATNSSTIIVSINYPDRSIIPPANLDGDNYYSLINWYKINASELVITTLTMYSPNGTAWNCGVNNTGSWVCE